MLRKVQSTLGLVRAVRNWPSALIDHAGMSRRPYVCRLRNGLRFHVRAGTDDSRVTFEIFVQGCYQAARVRPGATIIDIGANIGLFSLVAAQKAATVLAFEPEPENFAILQKNCRLNEAHNVTARQLAVSDTSGVSRLYLPDNDGLTGRHSLYSGRGSRSLEVSCATLDEIVADGGYECVDLVKLDCEGSEYGILFGVRISTLNRVRQIIVECGKFQSNSKNSQEELAKYLNGLGFSTESHDKILYASKPVAE